MLLPNSTKENKTPTNKSGASVVEIIRNTLTILVIVGGIFLITNTTLSSPGDSSTAASSKGKGKPNGGGNKTSLDQKYLSKVRVTTFETETGAESFTITKDGKLLRNNIRGDIYLFGHGDIELDYDIVSRPGGVDILATVSNTTDLPQLFRYIRIEGIIQDNPNAAFGLTEVGRQVNQIVPIDLSLNQI